MSAQKLTDDEIIAAMRAAGATTITFIRSHLLSLFGRRTDGITRGYIDRRLRELEVRKMVRRCGTSESDKRMRLWEVV
jgi:hypothetical protein